MHPGTSRAGEFAGHSAGNIALEPQRALALSELLQLLSCGEESATATFEHLARASAELAVRSALTQIASDERRHQLLLGALSAALPQADRDPRVEARTRRFFMRMADRNVLIHFVRIAALDSAACQLLGLLTSRAGPLPVNSHAAWVLRRIQSDEARHVRVARLCAGPLVSSTRGREIAAEVRDELAQLILLRGDCLEALSIDPDRFTARLRRIPRISEGAQCQE